MLYLEDFLEMMEHLPQEVRDRFTEIREMDLRVSNSASELSKRINRFFAAYNSLTEVERDLEHKAIVNKFCFTVDEAEEKVQLAHNMYELVAKYYKRLESEIHKFKMELEADHMGITEIIEKRSEQETELSNANSSHKENKYLYPQRISHHERRRDSADHHHRNQISRIQVGTSQNTSILDNNRLTDVRVSGNNNSTNNFLSCTSTILSSTNVGTLPSSLISPHVTGTVSYPGLSHIGPGAPAIAAAASQAIAATQQMQQGRRTASLKASYEAIGVVVSGASGAGGSGATGEINISKEIAGAAQTAIAAIQDTHKKHKKKLSVSVPSPMAHSPASPASTSDRLQNSVIIEPPPVDEPRWCTCNQVAYGMMVACDNKNCPHEWYHYPCVGITEKPKGKWYCPHCTSIIKRNRHKK